MNFHDVGKVEEKEQRFEDYIGENPLLIALRIIRDECNKCDCCADCPLRTYNNTCSLTYTNPCDWTLAADEGPKPPRLFA